MNKMKLNEAKTKLIYEHQDTYGGCEHEISVRSLLRTLKPVIEKKQYLFPDLSEHTTLFMTRDRENKDQFMVKYYLDDQLLFNIWCDRISVFAGDPPTFCLSAGGIEILGIGARLMTVDPEAEEAILGEVMTKLKKYILIGKDEIKC